MIAPAQPRSIGGVYLAGILGGGTATNPMPPPGYITANMLADAYATAAALASETARAEGVEEDLGVQITQAVETAIINANAGITSESQARVAAINSLEATIQTLTASVANTATNVGVFNATLTNSINSEASTRSSADIGLNAQIANLKTALANEAARATTAEGQRLQIAKNLSDLTNVSAARINLGLGTAAQSDTSQFDSAGSAATVNNALTAEITRAQSTEAQKLAKSANLGDLTNVTVAQTNLGLGSAATQPSTAFDAAGSANTERVRAEAVEATLAPLNEVLLLNSSPQTVDGTVNFTGTTEISGQAVVTTNDSRLSDTRNPNAGSVGTTALGDGAVTSTKISPTAGILATQLATAVQTALALANTSIQSINTKEGANITLTAGDVEAIPIDIVTTKGDLIVAADTSEPIRLPIDVDGKVLTTDSTSDYGMSWKVPTGGGGGGGDVSSVFGRTGAVVGTTGDYAVGQVTGAAPLASPTFTGTVIAPTPTTGDSSTKVATTAFVSGATSPLVAKVHTVATSGSAQIIPGMSTATISQITLTANCALTFPAPVAGTNFYVALTQDGTGSRTVTWDAAVVWPSGVAPTLTTTTNRTDWFFFTCIDGVHYLGDPIGQNYNISGGGGGPTAGMLTLTAVASDNFNRANGPLAGSNNWAAISSGGMSILSDEAVGAAGQQLGDYRITETYNSNQYAQFTVGSVALSTGDYVALTLRNQNNNNNYLLLYFLAGAQYTLAIYSKVSGTYTPLATNDLPGALPQGTQVTFIAENNVLSSRINNSAYNVTQVAAIDNTFTGGTPGIESFGTGTVDNWLAGNAATTPVGAALATDNFNRANGNVSTGQANWALMNYVYTPATVEVTIVSNQLDVEDPPTVEHAGNVRTDSYNADHWSGIQIGTIEMNGTGFVGATVRNQGSGGTLGNAGYLGCKFQNRIYAIYRLDAGNPSVSTAIAGAICPPDDPAGTQIDLIAQGSNLYLLINNSQVFAVSDGTYTGGAPGIMLFPNAWADNWSGGNV